MWYIVTVAVLNLGLGFALGVAQGRRPRGALERAVAKVERRVDRYGQRLASLDYRLRRAKASPDEVSAVVAQIGAAHRDFLAKGEAIADALDTPGEAAEIEQARVRLAQLWKQQCEEVAQAERAASEFQPADNLDEQRQRLSQQNADLLQGNVRLSAALDEALAEVARAESWTTRNAGERLAAAPGLESFWADWWNGDPDRARQLSAGAVDVDQLARVNQRVGTQGADRLLQAIAQVLVAECGAASRVTRASGSTFLVLLPETDLRAATTLLERARQRIERTRFTFNGESVQVTVSCGLTESGQADATESLMERVETTLAEAKRYGRNRTFVHEGKFPTPVVPPGFEIEERVIEL